MRKKASGELDFVIPRLYNSNRRYAHAYEGYPAEVAAYLKSGAKRAVSVDAARPYIIIARFEDGAIREYDMQGKLFGMLSGLQDYELSRRVYLDDTNSIAWDTPDGHIDTSKDTVYIYGKPLN